jgi:hypothetical protein
MNSSSGASNNKRAIVGSPPRAAVETEGREQTWRELGFPTRYDRIKSPNTRVMKGKEERKDGRQKKIPESLY